MNISTIKIDTIWNKISKESFKEVSTKRKINSLSGLPNWSNTMPETIKVTPRGRIINNPVIKAPLIDLIILEVLFNLNGFANEK